MKRSLVGAVTGCGAESSKASAADKSGEAATQAVADRIIFINQGKIVEEAPCNEFFENPKTERLQKFLKTFSYAV